MCILIQSDIGEWPNFLTCEQTLTPKLEGLCKVHFKRNTNNTLANAIDLRTVDSIIDDYGVNLILIRNTLQSTL